jgi:hypothetical protein
MTSDAALDSPAESVTEGGEADWMMCQVHLGNGDSGCILTDDLTPVPANLDASVHVVSIDDLAADGCARLQNWTAALGASSGSDPVKKIVMTDGITRWIFFARIPDLPSDLLRVGDQIDLHVTALVVGLSTLPAINQTVVMSRNGQLILFASNLRSPTGGRMPRLDDYGIALTDEGPICNYIVLPPFSSCSFSDHRTRVASGGQSATLSPGETILVGNLSLSVSVFLTYGTGIQDCDRFFPTEMAGFVKQ